MALKGQILLTWVLCTWTGWGLEVPSKEPAPSCSMTVCVYINTGNWSVIPTEESLTFVSGKHFSLNLCTWVVCQGMEEGRSCCLSWLARYITEGVSGALKLSPGFICSPASKSDASISYAEWFPPLIIVLLAWICITAYGRNLKGRQISGKMCCSQILAHPPIFPILTRSWHWVLKRNPNKSLIVREEILMIEEGTSKFATWCLVLGVFFSSGCQLAGVAQPKQMFLFSTRVLQQRDKVDFSLLVVLVREWVMWNLVCALPGRKQLFAWAPTPDFQ